MNLSIKSNLRFLIILFSIVSISVSGQNAEFELEKRLVNCTDNYSELLTIENDTFLIKYPELWVEDNKIANGLDLSSKEFPDSNLRTFLLTIVPYSQFKSFAKKNPMINYYHYSNGSFHELEAIFSIRNDLKKGSDNSVFWKAELKLVDAKNDLMFIMVFGKPAQMNKEPGWCEFEPILSSFTTKM